MACGASEPPQGDPCKDTAHYYAGPEFPSSLLERLPVKATGVHLSWEHGSLQEVTLHLAPGVDEAAAKAALPSAPLPDNVQSVDVQACNPNFLCASLEGFDHMGAGDVDCGD